MILAIDIGNSHIMLGGFVGDEPAFVVRLATEANRTEDEYAGKIVSALSLYDVGRADVKGAIISSVVPPLNAIMKKAVRLVFGVDPLMVGPGIKTGINIHCDNPSSVGSDLICASVAAHHIYGSPSLIVDMGTATKMMVVNPKGAFIGVSIMPGVLMGMNALARETAQLPTVSLEAPGAVVAKNTVDCIKSGVIYGNAGMVDSMIDCIREEVGYDAPVYATGGLAPIIIPHCKHAIRIDENLILKGLYFLYQKNR